MSGAGGPGEERHHRAERARLFVALELPRDVRDAVIEWRQEALTARPGLRFVARENLHVTLCFLGGRWAREIEPIVAACRALPGRAPPEIALAQAIWLPRRRPRVLAVALDDPQHALADVQAALSELLAAGGWYTPEKRPYTAHVTVARVGRDGRAPRLELAPPPPMRFRAPCASLYRSRLAPGGARYEALARIELGG